MSATPVLRDATPDDLAPIMALEERLFPGDAWSAAMMAAELAAPHTRYLVAEVEGVVVGYAGLSALPGSTQADIQTIAVDAPHRRLGLGTALLTALLEEAARRGATEVLLEVRADNPGAQALYERHGFEAIAVRPRYYQPDDVDAIVMRREGGA
jgi:ribosomal-protein-alanine acetyltransferase